MPILTGDDVLDAQLQVVLSEMVQRRADAARTGRLAIRESAVHDFSSYQLILEPILLRSPSVSERPGAASAVDGSAISAEDWLEFEAFVQLFPTEFQALVEDWVLVNDPTIDRDSSDYTIAYEPTQRLERVIRPTVRQAREGFRAGMAPPLYFVYAALKDRAEGRLLNAERAAAEARVDRYVEAAVEVVTNWLRSRLDAMRASDGTYQASTLRQVRYGSFWAAGVNGVLDQLRDFVDEADRFRPDDNGYDPSVDLPSSYEFEPFLPFSINFGLQTIFRQAWVPLGTQPGEIVRTLPLGPKQSQKVTVKAIRRTKSTRQSEISTSIETSTDSSAATKDSSEVMQEASESMNWHVEASASASFGFGSASMTAGAGGENSSGSRDTKSMLNETMEKTSSKIRKDTKIVVSTETEQTDEFSSVSEISNPNDEIAVTYVYSRLQRQYELQSYLAEANAVIYVAEKIPTPSEIDGPWIRRYDWIISQALLDESFRADLDAIKNHEIDLPLEGVDANIESLMKTLSESSSGIPDYSTLTGDLSMPDLFANQQQAYEREIERRRARDADQAQYRRSVRRLSMHIFDNILHYCRAIWSSEDPDARLLRYRDIRVPIKWDIVTTDGSGSIAQVYVTPSVTDEERDTESLSEMINPVGPIGFAGNYAVYYLKDSSRWHSLQEILRLIQTPYRELQLELSHDNGLAIEGVVSDIRMGPGSYRLTALSVDPVVFHVEEQIEPETFDTVGERTVNTRNTIEFHSIKLRFGDPSTISVGQVVHVAVHIEPYLEDPEVKSLRWREFDAGPADDSYFTDEVVREMRDYFDAVRAVLTDHPYMVSFADLDGQEKSLVREFRYDHLVRRRYTRRILVDTNNVLLTREVDSTATLEPYKEIHRLLDVLKTGEELKEDQLENERRRKRIDAELLGDPAIEKLTVVAGTNSVKDLAPLDGLEEDPEPEGGGS